MGRVEMSHNYNEYEKCCVTCYFYETDDYHYYCRNKEQRVQIEPNGYCDLWKGW